MPEKHLSSQFDSELNGVSTRVMEMGAGRVPDPPRHLCTVPVQSGIGGPGDWPSRSA